MPVNLKGVIPDKAVSVITQLQADLASLTGNFKSLMKNGVLTPDQAEKAYGPDAQRKALQASGKSPMNLSGLPGAQTVGFNGTLAAAISGGKNVVNGVIQP